ncbi:MAG: helix-turn-helix domain-containing protein [Gemmatimonadales bacterium]
MTVVHVCGPASIGFAVADALRGLASVRVSAPIAELRGRRKDDRTVAAVLVAPRDPTGASGSVFIRELTTANPTIPVIAICDAGLDHSATIRELAAAGAHELLFPQLDLTGSSLRSIIATARHECVTAAVLDRVLPLFPRWLHPFVEQCVAQHETATRVADVARILGVNRKTLFAHCLRHDLPGPAEILSWCRLFMAAYLLEHSQRTIEAIALDLDWASSTALRNMMKRYTGCRASDIRRLGGLTRVIDAFERRREARERSSA